MPQRRRSCASSFVLAALMAALCARPSSPYALPSREGDAGIQSRDPPPPAPSMSTDPRAISDTKVAPDNVQLNAVREVFERPRVGGIEAPPEALPGWLVNWSVTLQNQLDGVFVSLGRHRSRKEELSKRRSQFRRGGVRVGVGNRVGFKIVIVGDSTMRMQAKVLASLLSSRTHAGGRRQCFDIAHRDPNDSQDFTVHWSCMGRAGVVGREVVLTLEYVQANEVCVAERNVNADFVYFGCGLRLLQLVPDRPEQPTPLDTWVHYERLLEDAVNFYRSGGGQGKKKPIGLSFMTTHSFAVERLEGEYKTRVREYAEREASLLELCRSTVSNVGLLHPEWPNELDPEEICTQGTFDEAGVVNLNRRAESVMARLGVPMVRGYDITRKQAWATLPADGRHYPALIPLQLHSFLLEVTSALRKEIRSAYFDANSSFSFDKTAEDYYNYDDGGDDGDVSLSVFMPLSVALLVLFVVGSASASAAACCTLLWTRKGT
eukprot:g8696.t1